VVAGREVGDGGSNLLDNTRAFMAANDRTGSQPINDQRQL